MPSPEMTVDAVGLPLKWWHIYLMVWAVAMAMGAFLTFFCKKMARRLGFVDRPHSERHKRHRRPVPVLGGPALFLSWAATIGLGLFIVAGGSMSGLPERIMTYLPGVEMRLPQLAWVVGGALVLVLMGMLDDRHALPALPKFLIQAAVCGLVAWQGDIRVSVFIPYPGLALALSILWLLTILNAINFLDNMDGLAAGIAAIASFFFAIVGAVQQQYFVTVFSVVLCGASCGFLFFNRPPASIFMGDSGSQFLGFCLGVIGALTTYCTPESQSPAPVLIPVLILGVPLFDLAAVVFIRTRMGRPFYMGDNRHISHRFENMGIGRPLSVLVVLLLVFASGAGAVTLMWLPRGGVALVFAQAFAILCIISILHVYTRSSAGENHGGGGTHR